MDDLSTSRIARAVAELSRLVVGESDLHAGLQTLAEAARETVPGCDNASVSLVLQGTLLTPAATDRVVVEVDLLQYDRGQGPCLDAMSERRVVRVDILGEDERYSHMAPGAVERGVRSILSSPLEAGGELLGALNLYSSRPNAFDEASEAAATPMAARAAEAIAGSQVYDVTRNLVDDVERALETRELIGEAKGVLMTRHSIGPEQASEMLRRTSEQEDRGLRDVAVELVSRRKSG